MKRIQISEISDNTFLWIYTEVIKKLGWDENDYIKLVVSLLNQTRWNGKKGLDLQMHLSLLTGGRSLVNALKLTFTDVDRPNGPKDTLVIRSHPTQEQADKEKNNAKELRVNTVDCFAKIVEEFELPKHHLVVYRDVSSAVLGKEASELSKVLYKLLSSARSEKDFVNRLALNLQEVTRQATKTYKELGACNQTKGSEYYGSNRFVSQLPPDFVITEKFALLDVSSENFIISLLKNAGNAKTISIHELDKLSDKKESLLEIKEKLWLENNDILKGKGKIAYLPFLVSVERDVRIWVGMSKSEASTIQPKLNINKGYKLLFFEKSLMFTRRLEEIGFDTKSCISSTHFQSVCEKRYQHLLTSECHNDLHCGNILESAGNLKIIDLGDKKRNLIASDIARLEVSLWFEAAKQLSKEEAEKVLNNLTKGEQNESNEQTSRIYIFSSILYRLKKGFEEGIEDLKSLVESQIELAYVIQILLYQRYCLLDGLEKISPAFNVFAHYWISRFQGDNPNKCVNEPIIIEVAEAKQSWEKLLVPSKKYENKRQKVHGIMLFLSALADSSEQRLTGRSLKIGYKKICKELWQQLEIEAKDIPSALNIVKDEMRKMNIHWPFHEASSLIQCEGYQEIKLVVTNCTIRCTLFRYGFLLGTALCQIRHSLFCGIFENVYGAKAELDIFKHGEKNSGAGENACLLNLKIYD